MEKVQWNSTDKIKIDLNIRKMTSHPPSPEKYWIKIIVNIYEDAMNLLSGYKYKF